MFALTFKATVGTGILAIPYVVQRFGMLGSIIGLAAFAAFSWYTMRTLLVCVNVIANTPTSQRKNIDGFDMPFEEPLRPVSESMPIGVCVSIKGNGENKIVLVIHSWLLLTDEHKSGCRKCWECISQDDHHNGPESRYIDYQAIGETAMGRVGSVLVIFAALLSQLGSVVAYVIFMSKALLSVLNESQTVRNAFITHTTEYATTHGVCSNPFIIFYRPNQAYEFQNWQTTAMVAPLLMLLALLRSPRLLEPTSHFGNLALFIGLGTVLYFGANECGSAVDIKATTLFHFPGFAVFFGAPTS